VSSFTRWVLRHKRFVVVGWLVLTVAGIAAAGPATDALKGEFSVPGKEGWKTAVAIAERYGTDRNGSKPLVPVVTLPEGKTVHSAGVKAELRQVDDRVKSALPDARIASFASTGSDAFVSKDGRTTFALVYPHPSAASSFGENPQAAESARSALSGATVDGALVHLTGFDALGNDGGSGSGPGVLLEAVIAGAAALIVLAVVFASLLALAPLAMAIASIMVTFLLLYGLTQVTTVSPIVQYLIALIGLGVAIDYTLLVATRWREERARGHVGDEAVQRTMETAGRAVLFSGVTVAIGLLALIALPVPFLRSMGYGGALIPLVSTLAALTLLPVILAKLGPRLDWPHRRSERDASRAWTGWAGLVTRRRWLAAGAGIAVVGALAFAATDLRLGTSNPDTIAQAGDARQGLTALERSGIGPGALFPHEVLVSGGTDPRPVASALERVTGIHGAVAPAGGDWRRADTALVEAIPVADSGSPQGKATLERVRNTAHATSADAHVGGAPALNDDFVDAVYGSFPLMVGLIALTTFVLLARAFRSLLLPAKAVALGVLSVAAVWGVMTLVWQQGHGSDEIWGIAATGSIPSWMPLMVFAFLFGLSMDYEVFILSRMREEYDRTGSTDAAVIRGLGRTGRLVTSAALILFLAFVSMASGPETDMKVIATGLAAGILLDATVIRALIVPALVSVMGRWNWWLPRWPARLLRVEPSLPPKTAPAQAEA
jgi:RND superfamily putative drug exporter